MSNVSSLDIFLTVCLGMSKCTETVLFISAGYSDLEIGANIQTLR